MFLVFQLLQQPRVFHGTRVRLDKNFWWCFVYWCECDEKWPQYSRVLVLTSIRVFHETKQKNKKNQISEYQKRLKTQKFRVRVCLCVCPISFQCVLHWMSASSWSESPECWLCKLIFGTSVWKLSNIHLGTHDWLMLLLLLCNLLLCKK